MTTIREITHLDGEAVLRIYREGIATGHATFQTEVPSMADWMEGHIEGFSLGYEDQGQLLGWAALSKVSSRCVYSGVAEVSIYVAQSARGRGIGASLMKALIEHSELGGIWTLQAGVFPENTASLTLHLNNGFREVGRREKLGKLGHVWRDVLLLERRSTRVGLE